MLLKITILDEYDKELINKIQKEHADKVSGIYELYDQLYVLGYCQSYSDSRIYYVAYTLAKNNIKVKISKVKE